jgi:hypothetical protein
MARLLLLVWRPLLLLPLLLPWLLLMRARCVHPASPPRALLHAAAAWPAAAPAAAAAPDPPLATAP